MGEQFYVAIITPVIHYCMGGLECTVDAECILKSGKVIPGLYVAGEAAGGIHGNNRLGGNSLLDCVVFGRVSGKAAAKYILGDDVKETSLADLSGGGLSGKVESSKLSGGSYEDGMNKSGSAPAKPAEATSKKAAPAKKKKSGGGGGLTMAEVGKHTTKTDCWVVLRGEVLNVTNFLSQHTGGELAILTFAGKDASAEFDMIHPPDMIEKYAPDAVIGMIGGASAEAAPAASAPANTGAAAAAQPLLGGEKTKKWTMTEKNRQIRMNNEGLIPGWIGAFCYMVLGFLKEIIFTIIPQTNVQLTNDRVGLTRSAMFL